LTDDWKEAFFKMARIAFDESTVECSTERIIAALKNLEDQEAVIDFLEGIFNDDDFDDETRKEVVPYFVEKAREGIKAKKELLEVYAEIEVQRIEERERVKEGRLGVTVKGIAQRIIYKHGLERTDALLKLIPEPLLGTELSDENLSELGNKIDEIRFKKEDELSVMLQMVKPDEKDMQRLREVINGTVKIAGEFNQSQKQKIREIKFLSSVAQTIIHQ